MDGVAAAEEAVDEAGAEAAGGVHDADGVGGLAEGSGRHPRERERSKRRRRQRWW